MINQQTGEPSHLRQVHALSSGNKPRCQRCFRLFEDVKRLKAHTRAIASCIVQQLDDTGFGEDVKAMLRARKQQGGDLADNESRCKWIYINFCSHLQPRSPSCCKSYYCLYPSVPFILLTPCRITNTSSASRWWERRVKVPISTTADLCNERVAIICESLNAGIQDEVHRFQTRAKRHIHDALHNSTSKFGDYATLQAGDPGSPAWATYRICWARQSKGRQRTGPPRFRRPGRASCVPALPSA